MTKFCAMAPNIYGPSIWNLILVTLWSLEFLDGSYIFLKSVYLCSKRPESLNTHLLDFSSKFYKVCGFTFCHCKWIQKLSALWLCVPLNKGA